MVYKVLTELKGELITSGQGFNGSCLCSEGSTKSAKDRTCLESSRLGELMEVLAE